MIKKAEIEIPSGFQMKSYAELHSEGRTFKILTYNSEGKWIYRVFEAKTRLFDSIWQEYVELRDEVFPEIKAEIRKSYSITAEITEHFFVNNIEVTQTQHEKNMEDFIKRI